MSRYKQQMRMIRKSYEDAYAVKSAEVKAQNTYRTMFYKSMLWRLFLGSVKIVIPDWWSMDYFRNALLLGGRVAVTERNGVIIPFAFQVNTVDDWKYPVTISSCDEVDVGERVVGINTEIIYMTEAYPLGEFTLDIQSMLEVYSEKMASADGAIDTNLMVSRTPWLAEVSNSSDRDNMQRMFAKMMSGEPAVFYKKRDADIAAKHETPFVTLPVKQNFVADIVQDSKRSILNEFLTLIGINNVATEKRERLITDEVNANNEELKCAVALWQDNVNRCVEKVNKHYGTDIKITFGGDALDTVRTNADISNEES